MASASEIEKYVKRCFSVYGLDISEYFFNDFGDGEWTEMEWVDEDGELHPYMLPFASEILGIDEKDIFGCSEEAMWKWSSNYPYFHYIRPYAIAYDRTFFKSDIYDKNRLLKVIFGEEIDVPSPTRFDYAAIKERLIEQLKDIGKSYPEVYHEGAKITKLEISTENFCHFEGITEMANSFISMVDRAIALFLKAVKQDLNVEEIQEYNFLVSVLGIRDRYFTKGYLYYSDLVKVRELYSSLNESSFRGSIKFKRGMAFKPWRCAEFLADEDLVERYLCAMPEAKGIMREFAINATQFKCVFVWSDAKPIQFSAEQEAEMAYLDKMVGEEPLPLEERAKEPTYIYVAKTAGELSGDDITAKMLLRYCRPVRLGGIESKQPVYTAAESIAHISFLLKKKVRSHNFIDRVIADLGFSEGGQL